MRKILAISGSTRHPSSNSNILQYISGLLPAGYIVDFFEDLDNLPHFNPDLDNAELPVAVADFRAKIATADGILICTPEYVFSLPGSLKNALEWCVSTTLLSHKNTGLVTASASGEKGHEQLLLIMKTLEARFTSETQLLIQGVRGKINPEGILTDASTAQQLKAFAMAFQELVESNG
ncbi:NADPH-dependent FMN reductase [Flavobacterium humi]|uniref:NAD(P)H-dependent oxidoreductase n=1 Tax=Flavobacterium humi TaxID=2562683 RepID=A0A4Z0L4P8_9FLAO|nr:NADPH-dependent FMN reductase [Flavobacterium humi]TGD56936.1 NAD(P)H-dependent oxidoreductase [Flavobacterium humi]